MSIKKLSIEERLKRLEELFSFEDNAVTLSLTKGDNTITIGATVDSAFVSASGKNHLAAMDTRDDVSGFGVYHKETGEKPVIYIFADDSGEGRVQCEKDGQTISTGFGIVETAKEAEPQPQGRVSPVMKPRA